MRAVLDELDRMNGEPIDVIGRDELVSAVARAALLGARGNSGVILSQIVRGAAEELASRPGELVDPVLVAAAFARAADAAYASVRDPAEGTMLSAVRAMAHRVAHDLAHMDTPRLGPGRHPRGAGRADRRGARARAGGRQGGRRARPRAAARCCARPGVVDAGAYGLTVIVAGVLAALRGAAAPQLEHQYAPGRQLHQPEHESSSFRYCTNFAVTGERARRPAASTALLEDIGDSVLVVGDERTLRVHVHTDEPERGRGAVRAGRRGLAPRRGRHARAGGRAQRAPRAATARATGAGRCAVVAVASGAGIGAPLRGARRAGGRRRRRR